MGYRGKTSRFHIETGPPSLFERVKFIMSKKQKLYFHGNHVSKRAIERSAPIDLMTEFDASKWNLMTAEVDEKKGKFVSSAWQKYVDGRSWWIVIGLGEAIKTIIETDKRGLSDEIICDGPLYEKVESVNRELMNQENTNT